MSRHRQCQPFDLKPGRKIGRCYCVERLLGSGIEGEVYQVREIGTDIRRAAKIYYPHRDRRKLATVWNARKLHMLRHCPIVLQYHHSEHITIRRQVYQCMISELCEGLPLGTYLQRHRGGRMHPFKALHVLYPLVRGLESIHLLGEYHADVHTDNILIRPSGLGFQLKLVDFYDWGRPTRAKQQQDILDAVRLFHECLGGRHHYAKLPPEIKYICAGLKATLILKRFPRIGDLRKYLENIDWQSCL